MSAALDKRLSILHTGGTFCQSRVTEATVAQLVEQLIRNQQPLPIPTINLHVKPQPLVKLCLSAIEGSHAAYQIGRETHRLIQSVAFDTLAGVVPS